MNQAATFLADKCPQDMGLGGIFHHDPISNAFLSYSFSFGRRLTTPARARYLNANGNQLPDIMLVGPNSRAKRVLDRMLECDARGVKGCLSQAGGPRKRPNVKKQHSRPKPKLPTIEEETPLSRSCLKHADCKIEYDYICASENGKSILR